jgi:4-hydroxybenzoate polyprenyltransferase
MIKQIYGILRLVRWVNLLIIALSMFLFQYCVIHTYLIASDTELAMSKIYFSLLVLSTVLIAAAGNVVNSYLDYEQDVEYKPEKVIIGKYISLDGAFNLQLGLSVIGILIGFFLSYHFGNIRLGYIFLSATALLWLYSQFLKRYFLIGNIVVAGLSAIVFVLPVLFESHLIAYFKTDLQQMATDTIMAELKLYVFFAFTVSLIREIVKDAEDKDGDAAYGMKTLPVVLPVWATNAIVILLMLGLMAVIGYVELFFWQHGLKKHFWFSIFFLQFPILTNMFTVFISKREEDYHNISVLLKMLMFFGIASLPVFYMFITRWQ